MKTVNNCIVKLSITRNAFIDCYIKRKKYLIGNFQKLSSGNQTPADIDKCPLPFGTLINKKFIEAGKNDTDNARFVLIFGKFDKFDTLNSQIY